MKIDKDGPGGVDWLIINGAAVRWSAISAVWWNGEEWIVDVTGHRGFGFRMNTKQARKVFGETCIKV